MSAPLALLVTLAAVDGGARPPAPSLLPPVVSGKPVETPAAYRLRGVEGGGYEYDDARFRAKIARDGRVSFVDRRGSMVFSLLPIWPQPLPEGTPSVEGSVRQLLGKRRRGPPPPPRDPKAEPATTTAQGAPLDERERKWRAETAMIPVMVAKGTMDLTDEYLRLMGEDPYRREKARFLASTFDMRLQMAVKAEAQDLRTALGALPDRLAAIWGDRGQPAPARRRLICGLWSELSGKTGAEPNAEADPKATPPAARIIENFVRTHLPAGSPDAFTAQELGACGDGRGAHFAPYTAATP
jgi:hypothetical protein